ncbi:3-oxoacyl-ACP reductase family protein [Micromonospora sp. DT31]|uniref:3-oxoacyl-ACP reductase family protein n=1 Tax=Micromonospora sp. DT31 TaxID=3393434 RepID=UPI003CF0E113
MSLAGQIALVTGATKGIGHAIAVELARAGATVLVNYRRDEARAKEALEQVSEHGEAALVRGDVADAADVTRMFGGIRREYGRLDAFVNNAGITADGFALMMGDAKWRSVIDTNLTGAFLCCRAAGRLMVQQKSGSIVAVASTSGINAPAGQANYAASKAGLLAMVRVLAKEMGGYGVRVNAVIPGFVDTAMTRTMPRAELDGHLARVPLGRIGQPTDVASVVRVLLDPETAGYVTGTSVVVDGGMTC